MVSWIFLGEGSTLKSDQLPSDSNSRVTIPLSNNCRENSTVIWISGLSPFIESKITLSVRGPSVIRTQRPHFCWVDKSVVSTEHVLESNH